MKIGYACIPLSIHNKTTRTFTIKNYTTDKLIECTKSNLQDLYEILKYNASKGILMFRISSDIVPFGSHEINNFKWNEYFKDDFKRISDLIKNNSIRISMHPGQYTVLNSNNPSTVQKSIKDLEYHALFLDSISNDLSNKIILHIGGVYNNKEDALKRFVNVYKSLSSSVKNRLVIENDERSYCIDDLLKINDSINIPIIYDNLHYYCYEGKYTSPLKILNKIKDTWKNVDGTIKVHYSQQALNKRMGSHSNTILIENFLKYYNSLEEFNIDIMAEVKDKDFSAIKLANCIKEINNNGADINKDIILNTYKFFLMERGSDLFNISNSILYEKGIIEFYKFIDKYSNTPVSETLSLKAIKEFYLSIEEYLCKSEISYYNKILKNNDILKFKDYTLKIAERKSLDKILSNYFLHKT
ncbi:MAG: UV DNA damage repair endonuclease UvsE [Clostridium sp.]|uniref:UV DNA damage repair endonuclease UvsE n=1 Tax=Clostridium sp. TaxID=1506 RepID=UPI003F3BC034